MTRKTRLQLLAAPLAAGLLALSTGAARAATGTLLQGYEGGVVTTYLQAPASTEGFQSGPPVSNVAASGGKIYWQEDTKIFQAEPDVTHVTLLHENGHTPVDFAVDAPDHLYLESFDSAIVTLSLDQPDVSIGYYLAGDITNVAFGGGNVFWQEGTKLFESDIGFNNITMLFETSGTPVDFDVDYGAGLYFESFGSVIVTLSLYQPGSTIAFHYGSNISNIAVGGGRLYWQEDNKIFQANEDLTDISLLLEEGGTASDFAVLVDDPTRGVPEPATWAMMLAGFGLMGGLLRRRARALSPA